MILRTCITYYY